LLKEKDRKSEAISAPLESESPEVKEPVGFSEEEVKKEVKRENEIENFETKIAIAARNGQKWMEVPKNILVNLCRGEYPKSGYIIWKNVKVCEMGRAEELAKKDGETAFERVFPGETTKVGV